MARWRASSIALLVFPLLMLLHLYISPYTKVEESFNVQASHDILQYGVPLGGNAHLRFKTFYDHMKFPGAVPRTFIGAMTLAAIAKPIMWLSGTVDGEQQQIIGESRCPYVSEVSYTHDRCLVRSILGLFSAAAIVTYASGVRRAYGNSAAVWYSLFQGSQFHIWYYASRTLPNMFAFGISTFALSLLLPTAPSTTEARVKQTRLALYLLTLATIIFRCELALLLGSQCLYMLIRTGSNVGSAISLIRRVFVPAILTAIVAGLLLTVPIDTYFWQSRKLLWPELAAFLSNVFPKKDGLGASAWGTSPWHWYLSSALPRLLNGPLLLLPWTLTIPGLRTSNLDLIAPSLGYMILYSCLGHKETRFLFPIIPPVTAALARTADYIYQRSDRSTVFRVLTFWVTISTIIAAFCSHAILLPMSAQTYPGAHALASLHSLSLNYPPQPTIRVHLTNLALQTGVTHLLSTPSFTKSNLSTAGHDRSSLYLPGSHDGSRPALSSNTRTRWLYDKSDNETKFLTPTFWAQFDYVVVEDPGRVIGAWDVVDTIPSLGKLRLLRPDVGRGLLVCGGKERRREDDGLSRLVQAMYGGWAKTLYGVVHDSLREGYGLDKVVGRRFSLTMGWWLHGGLETKLYILKRAGGGIVP